MRTPRSSAWAARCCAACSRRSFTQVVTEEVSPTHVRITFNTVGGVPTYVRGLVLEAMQTQGAKDVSITFLNRADGGTVYDVKWAG